MHIVFLNKAEAFSNVIILNSPNDSELIKSLIPDEGSFSMISYLVLLKIFDEYKDHYYKYSGPLLSALFNSFINTEKEYQREIILSIIHKVLRSLSWADGVEDAIVSKSLDDVFHSLMALLVATLQTFPRIHFRLRTQALKVYIY